MRFRFVLIFSSGLLAAAVSAQDTTAEFRPAPPEADPPHWLFDASAYLYFVPDSRNFVLPMFTADRKRLHFEARYNYEDFETLSGWVGYNWSVGEDILLDFTLMIGGVVGNTNGVAPGFRGILEWWRLEFSSEGEFVFDFGDRTDSYMYTWSELRVSPADWFNVGLVAQRTRVHETELEIQRGFLAGLRAGGWTLSGYLFNPDLDQPTFVVAVEVEF